LDDAFRAQGSEDLGRRCPLGEEHDGFPCTRRPAGGGVLQPIGEVHHGDRPEQGDQQEDPEKPAGSAQERVSWKRKSSSRTAAAMRSTSPGEAPGGRRRAASTDVSVASWKRTGREVRPSSLRAKERIRSAKGLSTPSGERGTPTRIIPISSSSQKRRISAIAALSPRRSSVRRGVATRRSASDVASPIRFSPKSIARIRSIGK